LRQLGAEGIGGLFLVWCHIADHGTKKPGWSLDSTGKPMPEAELQEASHLAPATFTRLVQICAEVGHFKKSEWVSRGVIAIPAMIRRADTYTRRRVRTHFEHTSNKVGQSSSTRQDKTVHTKKPPVVPLAGGRITRANRKLAEEIVKKRFGVSGCPHIPKHHRSVDCVDATARELAARAS
jgi:hypothetical protein